MGSGLEYIYFDFASEDTLRHKPNITALLARLEQEGEYRFVGTRSPFEKGRVWVNFQNNNNFTMSFGVDFDNPRRLYFIVDAGALYSPNATNLKNVRSLVRACELLYMSLRPMYGYGLTSPAFHRIPPADGRARALYTFNFFGPTAIERLGRERVQAVPAWRRVEFDDGGLLLEMSPLPVVKHWDYMPKFEQGAAALGLERFYQLVGDVDSDE